MNSNASQLGDRIRECANILGNVATLLRATGIPRSSLDNYMSGHTEPPIARAAAIARAAGVRLEWLMTGEGPMRVEPPAPTTRHRSPELPMEPALMGRIVEAVRRLMNELSMRLPDADLGRIYLELYAEILTKAEGEEDYPALLELAGNRLRRDILKEEPGSGKRSA